MDRETKYFNECKGDGGLKHYQAMAKNSLKKDERINIRLATKDLMGIQKKAMQEGLPYQTLISSVLHKYVTGQLKSIEAE